MDSVTRIIPLREDQFASANEALALAFMEDPITAYFAPDRTKREKVSPWFWRSALRLGMRWGVVDTDESGRSAAVWMPPGSTSIPLHRIMRTPFAQVPFRLGLRGMWRFARATAPIEKAHKRQVPGPHWYLMALGVHPELQGRGIGSALLEQGHARAAENGHPCYLETATDYDVQFYSKRGYKQCEKFDLGDMKVVTMIRHTPQQEAGES